MTGLHVSTLALSAYTVIARHGARSRADILSMLLVVWMNTTEQEEVDAGVQYLLDRKYVVDDAGTIRPAVVIAGAAATVIRDPRNQTELLLLNGSP